MKRWLAIGLSMIGSMGCGSTPDSIPANDDAGSDGDALVDVRPEVATETGVPGPTRYPYGPSHSPLTAEVVARLRAIVSASPHRKDVFAKVGASNTVNVNFFHCFSGTDVKLDTHGALEPTRAFFRATLADATHDSFDRTSLAATIGWTAAKTLEGDPSPIAQEVEAIRPGIAVVLLGTNDTYPAGVQPFEANLRKVVQTLVSLGVAPILTTIPPRADTAEAHALVPEMNAIVRVVAQSSRVPLIDLHGALLPLPAFGLAGDGIHLQVYSSGGAHGCWLNAEGLTEGMNQRNLLTLESLDRFRRLVLGSEPVEPTPPSLAGAGSFEDPRVVDAIPFVDEGDTASSKVDTVDSYPSCGTQDESGPEIVYRVDLSAPTKLRVRVFADDGVDVDLHWLDSAAPSTCTARADKVLDIDATSGSHRLVVDTFVSSGVPRSGGFRLTIVTRE